MERAELKRKDLVYPELSYLIVGCAYDVFNKLAAGHHEKYYQRAFAVAFETKQIPFKEQVYFPLKFQEKIIGKTFFDFLVFDKIIVEIKKDNHFSKSHIEQVNSYLKISGLKLLLLFNFTAKGVVYKRLVNVTI
jgi:GxxExxY protein